MIASASSRWPLPSTPATPTISPRADLEREPVEAPALEIVDAAGRLSPGSTCGLLEAEQDGAAHHHLGELGFVRLRRRGLAHDGAPSQHRDAVGDREHLVELVADEHDRLAGVTQLPQVVEQVLGLGRGQHRRGLVEDQDVDAPVERLEDLDPLLLADREILDDGRRVDLRNRTASASSATFASDPSLSRIGPPSIPRMTFSATVNGSTSTKCWWTMPIPRAIASRGDAIFTSLPRIVIRALVRRIEAVEDPHQGGLARAVLADQRVDLARCAGRS